MTTTCRKCHQEEEHALRPNGSPQSQCKKCQRAYSKEHYKANKKEHNQRRYAHRKIERVVVKDSIRKIKESSPCLDCGNFYPYYVMQFDHVMGEKSFDIGNAMSSRSVKRILEEIDKCELVCANCHAERTQQRRGVVYR